MKVLVTGVAGFLGSHIADRFIESGHEVVGVDNLIGGYKENVPSSVQFHEFDLLDRDRLSRVMQDVELVVHSACTAYEGLSVFSPALVVNNTCQITVSTVSAAIENRVKKFIQMSSMARYGTQETLPFLESMTPKPQDPYGIAKLSSELLVKNLSDIHGMDFVILVPHNIIGPRQKFDDPYRNVASIMINRMLQGKQPIIYGDGEQMRCFSFIQDVIEPLYAACFSEAAIGEVINIGPDEGFVTINGLAEVIASKLDFELDPIYMPGRPQEVRLANCSADKARRILGYSTKTTLEIGISELVNWIRGKGPKPFLYHLPLELVNHLTPKTWSERLM